MASEKRQLTRDRRLMSGLVAVALLCTATLGWRVMAGATALAVPTRVPTVAPGAPVQIVFGGDTMLADAGIEKVGSGHADVLVSGVAHLLTGADEVVLNAEAPITDLIDGGNKGAKYSYATKPLDAQVLANAGVTILNLGNNHSMDRGAGGLADTMAWAAQHGISTVGAGPNRSVAEQPLVLDTAYGKIALVSFGENFGPSMRSATDQAGMVPFSASKIIRGYTLAKRAGADYVIAYVHWGDNYSSVNEQQRHWAGQMVDAGFDLIIGSGSHTLQAVERIKGVTVVYGLGNFVFGAPGRYASHASLGIAAVARLTWRPGGRSTLTFSCIQADNLVTDYSTRSCTKIEQAQAASVLGPDVIWRDDNGELVL